LLRMNTYPLISSDPPAQADFILIPYPEKDQKKLVRFLQQGSSLHPESWYPAAKILAENHQPSYKKFVEHWNGRQKLVLMGVGKEETYNKISQVCRWAAHQLIDRKTDQHLALILPDFLHPETISALSNGLQLSTLRIDYYKKEKSNRQLNISLHPAKKAAFKSIQEGIDLARVQEKICHLVNLPPNEKNPESIVQWAKRNFQDRDIQITVLDEEALINQGLNALHTVGKGSATPPRLLILEYLPEQGGKKLKHVGLVGKGVTFDTGGISLKDPLNMHLMKSDMGGAAAVLGTMDLVEKKGLPVRLTAILPLAENAIGPDAYRPGDIIRAYNGKSIEVIDTDAEGRLILADALSYLIKKYKPGYIVDLATLTGSCIQTLGNKAGGLFTANDDLAQSLLHAGNRTGERLWQLPLWPEYEDEMASDIADIKNLATKPVAGAITAAKFLEAFTESHPAWAHLDIAGVAMVDSDYSKMRSATAYGVLLISKWIEDLIN
jgi:leucyl aminopeptidase